MNRAKGLVYRGAQEFYAQRIPGGVATVTAGLDPPTQAFFGQPFLPHAWYDALPIVEISRVAAHAAGVTHATLVRENSAWLARRDVHGVYKFLLKLASPAAVAVRLPRASMQYFDFVESNATMASERECVAVQTGIPDPMVHWFAWAIEGFAPVALAAAGAKDVAVETQVGAGPERGTVRAVLRWR